MSEQSDEDAKETLRFIHTAINEIKDALEALAGTDSLGKHVLIVFTEDDDYYDYISHFFPDGYFGLTGGVCIKEHEVHIVVNGLNDSTRGTIAHELAHDSLYPRQPPLWLEEGVVQVVSKLVMKEDALPWTPERRLVHQQHWSWHGLESFWGGASFSRQDDLQQLSYELAEALVRRANADNPERFNGMLRDAVPEDGGEKACVEYLGMSLVHYIRQLLGDGPWYPPRRVND